MSEPRAHQKTIICHDCGLLLTLPPMPDKAVAGCVRCGAQLLSRTPDTIDRTLALSTAGFVLFLIANIYPFLGMRIEGFSQHTTLATGIVQLYQQGMQGMSVLVFITIFLIPLLQILGLIYICLPLKMGKAARHAAFVLRALTHLQPWGMMEVYLLGILISMVKLAKMATIIPGIASWAFVALIFVLAAAFSGMNPADIWRRLPLIKVPDRSGNQHGAADQTGSKLIGCHCCSLLCRVPDTVELCLCPRCRTPLHFRKTDSINRTWALLVAAAIFYLPANIFPVTITSALGHEQADTILSGVIYFMFSGSWHIALIIFVASVLIPLLKIMILVFLLLSVQTRSKWKPEDRTRLYRITEAVGRWSMVDVYVVTILISLVQLGPMANIDPGPGVIYFAAVVVITMFAAESFDPRLIWDAMEENK